MTFSISEIESGLQLLFAVAPAAVTEGKSLVTDAEAVFSSVATGEGGVQKITNLLGALSHLTAHAQSVASAVGAVIPHPATPAPAAAPAT